MKKILIAEDDPILAGRISNYFQKHADAIEIIRAKNGAEAIEVLKKEQISLLITDIQMPILDGLALLAHMHEHCPVVPCFVMTAHEIPDMEEDLARDIVRFFRKPLQMERFSQAVLETLKKDVPRGALYGISVIRFLQMIEMEKKTCVFEVLLADKGKGVFYFEEGTLYDAEFGNLKGEAAALEIITTQKAKFRFRDLPVKKVSRWIQTDLQDMIKTAIRREIELIEQKT